MKINQLKINNFAGINSLEVTPEGQDVTLSGQNGTGKSTVINAITWCLSGKNISGETDLQGVKPNDLENQDVEVTLTVEGIELTRRLREKRNKSGEVTAHETFYEINSVGVKKSEFDAKVSELTAGGDLHDLILPGAFQQRDWKDRRAILFKMAGEVSDVDIARQEGFDELAKQLETHPLDRLREQAKASLRKLKDEQKMLPHRIDEKKRELPDLSGVQQAKKDVESIEKQIAGLQKKSSEARKNDQVDKLHEELRAAKKEARELADARVIDAQNRAEQKKQNIRDEIAEIDQQIHSLESMQAPYKVQEDTAQIEKQIAQLREKYKEVSAWSVEPSEDDLRCPACERPYEQADAEKLRKKLNKIKSSELERISKEGQELKNDLEKIKKSNARSQEAADDLQKQIDEKSEQRKELKKQLESIEVAPESPSEREKELQQQAESLQKKIEEIEKQEPDSENEDKLSELQKERDRLRDIIGLEKQHDQVQQRINELEKELSECNDALAEKQRTLDNLDAIVEAKVNAIEGRLHEIFAPLSFRMFRRQLNGELKEICETELNGRIWSQLSTGEKVKAGIYICNALQRHFSVELPLLIDNAESLTTGGDIPLPETGQAFWCKVSKEKKLKVNVNTDRAETSKTSSEKESQ